MLSVMLLAAVATGGFLMGAQRSATDPATDAAASGNMSPEPEPAPPADEDPATDSRTTPTEDPTDNTSADPGPAETGNGAVNEPPASELEPTEQEQQTTEEEPTNSAASSTELVSTVERYVSALDRGDLRGAHAVLAPELTSRPGWSLQEFVDFWDGYLVGAVLLEVIETDQTRQQVTAQVDFSLTADGLSRERITLTMRPSNDGALLISDYEVVQADRLR